MKCYDELTWLSQIIKFIKFLIQPFYFYENISNTENLIYFKDVHVLGKIERLPNVSIDKDQRKVEKPF